MQRACCVPERTKYDPGLFRGTRFFRLRLFILGYTGDIVVNPYGVADLFWSK